MKLTSKKIVGRGEAFERAAATILDGADTSLSPAHVPRIPLQMARALVAQNARESGRRLVRTEISARGRIVAVLSAGPALARRKTSSPTHPPKRLPPHWAGRPRRGGVKIEHDWEVAAAFPAPPPTAGTCHPGSCAKANTQLKGAS